MSLWFFMFFFIILNKLFSYTVTYIMMDWSAEPAEKGKLIRLAFGMYYTTIVGTWCYLNSLVCIY